MLEEIRLIQGYTCCNAGGNKVFYRTEKYGLFCELDVDTGVVRILDKELLRSAPNYMTIIKNSIYAVDSKGKWIAESPKNAKAFAYYDISNETDSEFGGYYSVCYRDGKLHLFFKNCRTALEFDAESKEIKRYAFDPNNVLDGINVESSSIYDGILYMFSSKDNVVVSYSIDERRIIGKDVYNHVPKIASIMAGSGKIYLLSENTVYEYERGFKPIISIKDDYELRKLAIINNDIWLLPGAGNDIHVYSLSTETLKTIDDYPDDFEYQIGEGWTKYIGRCMTDNYLCWLIRAGNYFLRINKETGQNEWLKPEIIGINNAIKQFVSQKWFVNERYISLGSYIKNV